MNSTEIADWAGKQEPKDDSPAGYSSVTDSEVAKYLTQRALGHTIQEIATLYKRSTETVHRRLKPFETDTVEPAQQFIKSQALPAAIKVAQLLTSQQDKVALDAAKTFLTANKLAGNEEKQAPAGIVVTLGCQILVNQQVTQVTEPPLSDTAKNIE